MKKQIKKLTLNKATVSKLDSRTVYGGETAGCTVPSVNICEVDTEVCGTGTCYTAACGTGSCACPTNGCYTRYCSWGPNCTDPVEPV